MIYLYRVIVIPILLCASVSAQFITGKANTDLRIKQISYLAGNFDSLTRSFLKRGFSLEMGSRDPIGAFTNDIVFPNGTSIHLESRKRLGEEQVGNTNETNVAEITFEIGSIDTLAALLTKTGFGFQRFQSDSSHEQLYIDSLSPVILKFIPISSTKIDTSIHHRNGTFRIDWVLLSTSADVQLRLRALFDSLGIRKYHEGCCDYWRLGDEYDFTLIRFEPAKLKPLEGANRLSVEEGNIYFAF